MELSLTKNRLYCLAQTDTFVWSESEYVLPARCVGCPYALCYNNMRERMRDNLDRTQLQFDFEGAV